MSLDQAALPWNLNKPVLQPPLELLSGDTALLTALEKVVAAETRARDARVMLEEAAAGSIEAAKRGDHVAAATASQAGKPDPGRVQVKRAEERVAELEHQEGTLRELSVSARSAWNVELAKGAGKRRTVYDAEFDRLAQVALGALAEAEDALARRATVKALSTWYARNGEVFAPQRTEIAREVAELQTRLKALDVSVKNARENESLDRERELRERAGQRDRNEQRKADTAGAYSWSLGMQRSEPEVKDAA